MNKGFVSITLKEGTQDDSILTFTKEPCSDVLIQDGVAHFAGIFINEKHLEIIVTFTTDLILAVHMRCNSLTFSVGVGPGARIN